MGPNFRRNRLFECCIIHKYCKGIYVISVYNKNQNSSFHTMKKKLEWFKYVRMAFFSVEKPSVLQYTSTKNKYSTYAASPELILNLLTSKRKTGKKLVLQIIKPDL